MTTIVTRRRRIFGIGLNKTGTTSLSLALNDLGFSCLHNSKRVNRVVKSNKSSRKRKYRLLHPLDSHYIAFCDSPINELAQQLDEEYPGSRFICTTRALEPWLKSRVTQFGGKEDWHIRKWHEHNSFIAEYFKDRPQDLLNYPLCDGAGWEPLCAFLQVPVPTQKFPWKHKMTSSLRAKYKKRLSK